MSKVWKNPIVLPTGVTATVTDNIVEVKGPKGTLTQAIYPGIVAKVEENAVVLTCDSVELWKYWGTMRALVANMVHGVSEGYAKTLQVIGVGFDAALAGNAINFKLGFSHPVKFDLPTGIEVKIDKDQKTYFYNIYNDTIKAELTIYKTDSETGKRIPAAGVEFKIKDADGNYVTQTVTYPKKYTTDVFKTDEDGSVHLPAPLKYGEYKLVEIKAPHGYVLKDTEIPINVDGSSTEIFMNFDNKTQKGQVYVEKSGEMLSGAKESETDYGTLYSPVYKEKYLLVLRTK